MPIRNNIIAKLLILIGLICFFSSCTRYKDIVYLHESDTAGTANFYPYDVPEYKIQKRDILYVKVVTLNTEISEIINATPINTTNIYSNEASLYLYGYNVSESGYIELPIIGKVLVEDKTIDEAQKSIAVAAEKYLKDATVIVKLISFKFSVLGEVIRPGVYQNFNNQLTVLEAISQAGDITSFGDRRKVLVMRPMDKGTKTFRLDLTDKQLLSSDGFFLLPNDIVYVEPVKSRNFRNNIPSYTLFFSALTTFVLVLNYINPK